MRLYRHSSSSPGLQQDSGLKSKDAKNLGRKLNDWRPRWLRSGRIERVLNVLQARISWRLSAFVNVLLIVLLIALLSGCATTSQPPVKGMPPSELLVPPPPPGAMSELLEQILRRGRTSEPTSTP